MVCIHDNINLVTEKVFPSEISSPSETYKTWVLNGRWLGPIEWQLKFGHASAKGTSTRNFNNQEIQNARISTVTRKTSVEPHVQARETYGSNKNEGIVTWKLVDSTKLIAHGVAKRLAKSGTSRPLNLIFIKFQSTTGMGSLAGFKLAGQLHV
ncbi:unnamed protein product [Dovyalis caffra]|uniref:Uncharacterized protein n=1 Tax=Dovyalis caffra TaxID=77055 RepID=A0AAV1S5P3_9ROSI|nr:unnamed protein product [Dovyalis caffra]